MFRRTGLPVTRLPTLDRSHRGHPGLPRMSYLRSLTWGRVPDVLRVPPAGRRGRVLRVHPTGLTFSSRLVSYVPGVVVDVCGSRPPAGGLGEPTHDSLPGGSENPRIRTRLGSQRRLLVPLAHRLPDSDPGPYDLPVTGLYQSASRTPVQDPSPVTLDYRPSSCPGSVATDLHFSRPCLGERTRQGGRR